MSLPASLRDQLALPVIGSPLFIVSNPELVIAQCQAGIIGAFPALNARPAEELERWLTRIQNALDEHRATHPHAKVAPYAVNQIVHHSNDRLQHDLDVCVRHHVPIVITSLRAPHDAVPAIHSYGGLVFHDVINVRHAEKALEAGVDGLILVCAGAGGHAGTLSPFALVSEVRRFYDGPLILSGAITKGEHVLAAQAMGADLAYMGTRFIATHEANAPAGVQADDRRRRREGRGLHEPVHRRARQLPARQHRSVGARPRRPAERRQEHDEVRLGRQQQVEGVARHLGRRARVWATSSTWRRRAR